MLWAPTHNVRLLRLWSSNTKITPFDTTMFKHFWLGIYAHGSASEPVSSQNVYLQIDKLIITEVAEMKTVRKSWKLYPLHCPRMPPIPQTTNLWYKFRVLHEIWVSYFSSDVTIFNKSSDPKTVNFDERNIYFIKISYPFLFPPPQVP